MKLQTARLLKLAQHLETGKLGHDRFDFSVVSQVDYEDGHPCGTLGCAIGELPFVFPGAFKIADCPDVPTRRKVYRVGGVCEGDGVDCVGDERRLWFGTEVLEDLHLFFPYVQNPTRYGGELLGYAATKEQVAAGIRAFVAIRESGR